MESGGFGESNLVAVFMVKQKSLTKLCVSVGVLSDNPISYLNAELWENRM